LPPAGSCGQAAAAGGGAELATALPAADNSTCALEYDGFLTIAGKGVGAYFAAQPTGTPGTGTPLTSDSAGGIVEIDTMLKDRWDKYRLGPDVLLVNSQEAVNMTKKVIAGGSAPLFRFNLDAKTMQDVAQGQLQAGVVIGSYLNKFMQKKVQVMVHPNVPPGTIMGRCTEPPYKLSGVQNIEQIRLRRDYYQVEWPRRSRKYEYGVYFDGVMQHYFPPAIMVLTNLANG